MYSFFGFVLEVVYSRVTGGRGGRKCLLLLPLCPVYGFGACIVLLLPQWVQNRPALLFLLGGAAATGIEYLSSVFYQRALGVSFWDYQGLPGSIKGRICLPFSFVWGVLALVLAYGVHPILAPSLSAIPQPVFWLALATLVTDMAVSAVLLRRTQDLRGLRWYDAHHPA